jgi:hypothetical protein
LIGIGEIGQLFIYALFGGPTKKARLTTPIKSLFNSFPANLEILANCIVCLIGIGDPVRAYFDEFVLCL